MGLLTAIGQGVGLLPSDPATMQQPGVPPTVPQHGWLVNALDRGLLGGGIAASDLQRLQAQQAQYAYQKNQAFAQTLPQQLQAQFWADPAGVRAALEKGLEPITQKPDETTNYGGPTGQRVTAPGFDPVSGQGYQLGQGGTIATGGQPLPGDYTEGANSVYSKRNGTVSATISTPQAIPPGATPATFQPTVGIPGAPTPMGAGAPGGMAAPPPGMGVPSLAQIPAMFPGATVTSGLRSPQHNAAVGGVPTSWHMQGTADAPGAIDMTPPPGVGIPDFTGQVQTALPDARVIGEPDHVHVQPNRKNTGALPLPAALQTPGSPAGWAVGASKPLYGQAVFNPKTNRMEQTNLATGKVEDAGAGAFNPQSAKADLAKSEPILNYTSATDAYKAMLAAANLPEGGMRAYALRDTFARLINPGAVARVGTIEAIKQSQGVPANVKAWLMNLKGDGNVPPEIAQQILDVSHGFLAGHHASAKALNDSYAAQATRAQIDPRDATVPVEDVPGFAHLSLPPKDKLTSGDIYKTARGMAVWNGHGFVPYGQ